MRLPSPMPRGGRLAALLPLLMLLLPQSLPAAKAPPSGWSRWDSPAPEAMRTAIGKLP